MSTMDKVKNALHLNKENDITSTTGTTAATGSTATRRDAAEGVSGPHSSRLANAADPRVDSDRDGSRNLGAASNTRGTGTTGGFSGVGTGVNTTSSTNAGPHSSNIANKLDPRIDSDHDGSRNLGAANGTSSTGAYSGTQTGNHIGHTGDRGGISNSTNAGPHDSNLANKLDPRVDSDLDGRGNRHGATTGGILGASGSHATPGSGTTQNTAGPHNSDLANKLDPRVDSDLSGGKTFGGNLTNA